MENQSVPNRDNVKSIIDSGALGKPVDGTYYEGQQLYFLPSRKINDERVVVTDPHDPILGPKVKAFVRAFSNLQSQGPLEHNGMIYSAKVTEASTYVNRTTGEERKKDAMVFITAQVLIDGDDEEFADFADMMAELNTPAPKAETAE